MTVRRLVLVVALVTTGYLSANRLLSTPVDDGPDAEWQIDEAATPVVADDTRENLPTEANGSGAPDFGSPLPPASGLPRPDGAARPVALQLPTIGVEPRPIVPVGVEPDGAMEIPGPREVGWYRFGPSPNQADSAVLAAHIAAEGIDGVFRDLADLDPGDAFEVLNEDGVVQPYLVVDVAQYEKARLPFDDLFAEAGAPRLVLITCGGDFNPDLRSYDSNVVAYAVPAEDSALAAISSLVDPATVIDRWGSLGTN
jgi:LPXTG-site transpeptidase (sortase) family protein